MTISSISKPRIAPRGLDGLNVLWSSLDEMRAALVRIADVGGDDAAKEATRVIGKIDSFEPTVTLIGQIKAGKTALVNSMIGQTDLLPSDVNPWTSVVTSLHLNSRNRPEGTQALFRFFDEEEWDRLVSTGGRLGELAQRAGFDAEKDAVREQVMAMREKSRDRLGKRFELLLGTSHSYGTVTRDLIDRYVCYGSADDQGKPRGEDKGNRGRFADITKLANLYLDLPGYPTGLCLRDTPGVNDTFMMREQITLNSIRDSRLCIVVLSAHQALSTMDMALLRLVATVDARELVLFVNRIDELDDPATQVPEIEANFRSTLKKHDIAPDVPILFGSAIWALNALSDTLYKLPAPSRLALENWAAVNRNETRHQDPQERGWRLSGVPALHACIAERMVEGPGQAMLREIRDELSNLVTSIEVADGVSVKTTDITAEDIDAEKLDASIDKIREETLFALSDANRFAVDSLSERLTRAQTMFCDRAVEALQSHLDAYGTGKAWQYNPAGLRMMLRTAYQTFCSDAEGTTTEIYADASLRLEKLYIDVFGIEPGRVTLKPPTPSRPLPPTGVGKTIALDLNVAWWRKWWNGLRKREPAAQRYASLILKETDSILEELSDEIAPAFCKENETILATFIDSQRSILMSLAENPNEGDMVVGQKTAKRAAIDATRTIIDSVAA